MDNLEVNYLDYSLDGFCKVQKTFSGKHDFLFHMMLQSLSSLC